MEKRISVDRQLTNGNKSHLLNELSALPDLIKIAISQGSITADMAIKVNGQIKLLEFHERQHRTLSIKKLRIKKCFVFSPCDTPIEVPRSIQRFLRDIWRVQSLENFSIVWWD
ncbi:MAG: hypothetical protein LIO79_07965 [Rikenellaceae bacterium]|nr:hypothetical protein [Rikenellaceae bacterium]